jgi:hypothetical protein
VRREGTFLWYSANTELLQKLLGFLYAARWLAAPLTSPSPDLIHAIREYRKLADKPFTLQGSEYEQANLNVWNEPKYCSGSF